MLGYSEMKEAFKAVKVTESVYWVGAIDWEVRDFHGYLTDQGSTYNAYLVLDDKVTLIETVKEQFKNEMLARIASVVDPEKIDYIVSNHSEPDHSGALAEAIRVISPEKVFASENGVRALREHFGMDCVTAITDGETLSLGEKTLTFVETRMCHWPDSMVSYLNEEKLLFSQDAFGMHLATCERFADQLDPTLLDGEAAKYYANILLPLSKAVTMAIEKITRMNIELRIIAPDHGPIWRENPAKIVGDYARWARQERSNKAIVLYDTMWGSTALMARAIGEGLNAGGAQARLMPIRGTHRSDVATEILDAGALIVGAPTINNQMFPSMADVLSYLNGLRPIGLIGAAFGSYGWGGQATGQLAAAMEEMKVELIDSPIRVVYSPTSETFKQCYDLGLKVAETLKERNVTTS